MSFRARMLALALAAPLFFSTIAFAEAADSHVGAGTVLNPDSSGSSRPDASLPFTAQVLNGNFSAFPEVVRLSNGAGGLCSGTFVSTKVIITAAHCLPGREGTLSVRGNGGPLGNARCEKSPRAGNPPPGAQSQNASFVAHCGGGRCGAGGNGGIGGFDPNFPGDFGGGVPGFPGGGGFGDPSLVPGEAPPVNPASPGNPSRPAPAPRANPGQGRPAPDNTISIEDIKNDVAVCVVDNPVDDAFTACLETSPALPGRMQITGFGLSNNGSQIVDDGRQRSGTFPIRQGPAGIIETANGNLRSGPNAASAPGDSGGFVGTRDNQGRLKLRAVVSGGNTVLDGRELGRAPGPVLNPANTGISAFTDLQSPNNLAFLRDFAQRKGVSICGLSSSSGSPSAPAQRNDLIALTPGDLRSAGAGNFGFPAGLDPRFGGLDPRFGNFDPRFGGVGGVGFGGGFLPGEAGVVTPGAGFGRGNFGGLGVGRGNFGGLGFGRGNFGGLGFGRGNFGGLGFGRGAFVDPFDPFGELRGGSRLVRLGNGRLALVPSGGFGRGRSGFLRAGRRGRIVVAARGRGGRLRRRR